MFQPGLKDKMMPGITTRKLTLVITMGCRSFQEVAWALLSIGHRQTEQGSEIRSDRLEFQEERL